MIANRAVIRDARDFGKVAAQNLFQAGPEARSGSDHFHEHDAVLDAAIDDVALARHQGGLDARFDDLLDPRAQLGGGGVRVRIRFVRLFFDQGDSPRRPPVTSAGRIWNPPE